MSSTSPSDTVTLKNLSIPLPNGLGRSAFSLSSQPCTILITVVCHLLPGCISASAVKDDLPGERSVNYSSLGKRLYKEISEGAWGSFGVVAQRASEIVVEEHGKALSSIEVTVDRPRALLFSRSVSLTETIRAPTAGSGQSSWSIVSSKLCINHITTRTIIGLNPHERLEPQDLDVDIEFELGGDGSEPELEYKSLGLEVVRFLESSSYQTLETLSLSLVKHVLQSASCPTPADPSPPPSQAPTHFPGAVEVRIRKPSAMAFAECPILTVRRTWADLVKEGDDSGGVAGTTEESMAVIEENPELVSGARKKAFIAIGTNLGDRIANIREAISYLCTQTVSQNDAGAAGKGKEAENSVLLGRTSRLYESQPMYVEEQGKFINAVFEISTSLEPLELLRLLKRTESHLGRVKTIRNGPRIIDLDLIVYGEDESVRVGKEGDAEGSIGEGCGWLEVPHKGIVEREFVIVPLLDLLPRDFKHPALPTTLGDLLTSLPKARVTSLLPVLPFHDPSPTLALLPGRPRLMGIINCTPDSFSDGDTERVDESALDGLLAIAKHLIAEGADILDVGGMSTRPGVKDTDVSEDEELGRIIPLIQALRLDGVKVPISVDTFRAAVAEQAILAGASCINDVRGGREAGMLDVMAKLDVPVILMHSRGTSITMTSDEAKDYSAQGGVVEGVKSELATMVAAAEAAGIKRWNIILDPGIGFAKSLEGNLQLLKGLDGVLVPKESTRRYSTLVGASRKGFIGTITERKDPKDRESGTAAVTALCCTSGVVDIVRVHEPGPSKDVIEVFRAVRASSVES